MVRTLPALLASLALGGCLDESRGLEIMNKGAFEVSVRVTYDVWVEDEEGGSHQQVRIDETRVPPRESVELWYPPENLHVTIRRTVDDALLYDEWLDGSEFEAENGRIEIAVYP